MISLSTFLTHAIGHMTNKIMHQTILSSLVFFHSTDPCYVYGYMFLSPFLCAMDLESVFKIEINFYDSTITISIIG